MLGIDFALTPLCNVLKSPLRDFQVGPKIITHKPPFASFLPVTKGALEAVGITYPRWGEFKPQLFPLHRPRCVGYVKIGLASIKFINLRG
jgi:hypothetical protein